MKTEVKMFQVKKTTSSFKEPTLIFLILNPKLLMIITPQSELANLDPTDTVLLMTGIGKSEFDGSRTCYRILRRRTKQVLSTT